MTRYITDIERLKKLEPVMERCGVQPLDYLIYTKHPVLPCWVLESKASKTDIYFWNGENKLGIFDHYALESVLPDWCTNADFGCLRLQEELENLYPNRSFKWDTVDKYLARDIAEQSFLFRHERGSEKLNAMADLILLLDENGIELRKCESE